MNKRVELMPQGDLNMGDNISIIDAFKCYRHSVNNCCSAFSD